MDGPTTYNRDEGHAATRAIVMFRSRVALLGLLACVAGCEQGWWNGFLDPGQVGRFGSTPRKREIRRTLNLEMEEPDGVPGATEPTPDDISVRYAEAELEPSDVIEVTIYELLRAEDEWRGQRVVDEVGYITLPELGTIKVGGMTPRQLQMELVDRLQKGGKLVDPQVNVTVLQSQGKRYTVIGSVARTGTYAIPRPNFRLIDAIGDAGGIPPEIKTIYVLRSAGTKLKASKELAPATSPPGGAAPAAASQPAEGFKMSDVPLTPARLSRAVVASGLGVQTPTSTPASTPATSEVPVIEPLLPPPATKPREPTIEEMNELTPPPSPARPWRYDSARGQWVEDKPAVGAAPPASGTAPASASQATIDWGQVVEGETSTRVISIPTEQLLNGDARYNIVLRANDVVNVAPGPIGEFYVMGNVLRPGAYSLTAREVDVRAAIAAAGGFGPLATPSRAELIRRGTGDQEEIRSVDLDAIFSGRADNFYMKPNDILNVGTNALMPFIATVRNAFRVSYGFGFVYDRNFADIDSFSQQQNPNDRRRAQRQQLGFPFP